MAFDFPNAPSEGTVFSPGGGPVYVYTGGVWRMQGSQQTATAEARNRLVNGAMQHSQENGNTATGNLSTMTGYYAADQWVYLVTVSPGTANAQRVQVVTPNGSKDRLRLTVGTAKAALAAGDHIQLRQLVEGIRMADFRWGTGGAQQVVLRFGWKSPAGTYSVSMRNGAANRSYIAIFTVSAGQANTDTVQTLVIPGDTTGTWLTDTGIGAYLTFALAAGTTWQGAAGWQAGNVYATSANTNGMATAGAVYELFDVGLYLDPLATGVAPPWQMPDEAQELDACRRYWLNGGITAHALYWAWLSFSTVMRSAPVVATTPAFSNAAGQVTGISYQHGSTVAGSFVASARM